MRGNNNKMTENDIRKVWVQKLVIVCCFTTFRSFHSKSHQIFTGTIFSNTDMKRWGINWNEYRYGLGAKPCHLYIVLNISTFSVFHACKTHEMLTLTFLDPLLYQTTINRDIKRMYGSYEGKTSRIRLFARFGSFRVKRPEL